MDNFSALDQAARAQLRQQVAQQQGQPQRLQQPVAIIGPGEATARECELAQAIAGTLGQAGVAVICGGRGGVMAAAAKGVTAAGGLAIGLLPEADVEQANPYLSVAIPTGIGELRNGIIARSAMFLVTIGGSMGTLSEIALGLRMGKTVLSLESEWQVPGMVMCADYAELETRVLQLLLAQSENI